jgi:dTDP-4-amino-4,6-dideoxygalactose transaminase
MRKILFNDPIKNKKYSKNVVNFLNSNQSLHGPGKNILAIKKKIYTYFNFQHIHLTNSCTAAMEMAALMINLNNTDEVIIPSYTFVTTGSSFARTGCRIRYCDIDPKNLMPSFKNIQEKVNKKTKAIVIVHYQGFSIDYLDKLKFFCKKNKIFLIEDAAQAFGSYFKKKPLGSFGDFACFSFHQTKNIHSGIGGMLVVNNKKFRNKSNFIFDKGTDRSLVLSNKRKYFSWVEIGSCFLLPELNASYLLPQINEYKKICRYRSILYYRYIKNFKTWLNDEFKIYSNLNYKYNYHALVIVVKKNNRSSLLKFLIEHNIFAFIGYIPLHKSIIGKKYLDKKEILPGTEKLYKRIIRLPLHNHLSINDIDYVCKVIKKFYH